ncbi:cysteinyl-tRNA synthetase [bacterium]|nr:cysteinyl-tRNA synthetase [bacterium]
MNTPSIGLIALLGSGETLPSSGKTHEYIAQTLPENPVIGILETPAGFELNAKEVAGRIREFLEIRLQNYAPQIIQVPARKKGTANSPDSLEIVAPLLHADEILLGPGSPTYAVRQIQDSLLYEILKARHRRGSAIVLSSAATLAFSRYTIPVYEIYKVGEEIHWKDGLDFFGFLGFPLTVVPHWNNQDGGEELDTSRCYIGQRRFYQLVEMLPAGTIILGIDDHTSVVLDFNEGKCLVLGNGEAHLLRDGVQVDYATGETFPLTALGIEALPKSGPEIDPKVWQMVLDAEEEAAHAASQALIPPDDVLALLDARNAARDNKAWGEADALRDQITAAGWKIMDTPEGSQLLPLDADGR